MIEFSHNILLHFKTTEVFLQIYTEAQQNISFGIIFDGNIYSNKLIETSKQ